MITRHILALAVAAVVGLALADAVAQSYPSRPIRLIVPFPAGGPPDTLARLVGNDMSSRLGQTVVIDNRPGAGATIGTRVAAHAEPDGYTLLFASTTSLSIGPALFKNLDYQELRAGRLGVARLHGPGRGMPAYLRRPWPSSSATRRPIRASCMTAPARPPHMAWGLFTLRPGRRSSSSPIAA